MESLEEQQHCVRIWNKAHCNTFPTLNLFKMRESAKLKEKKLSLWWHCLISPVPHYKVLPSDESFTILSWWEWSLLGVLHTIVTNYKYTIWTKQITCPKLIQIQIWIAFFPQKSCYLPAKPRNTHPNYNLVFIISRFWTQNLAALLTSSLTWTKIKGQCFSGSSTSTSSQICGSF